MIFFSFNGWLRKRYSGAKAEPVRLNQKMMREVMRGEGSEKNCILLLIVKKNCTPVAYKTLKIPLEA